MTIIQTNKELKPRVLHDFYPTPREIILAAYKSYFDPEMERTPFLDPGCGNGVWGEVAQEFFKNEQDITGIDIRNVPFNSNYSRWTPGEDFLNYDFHAKEFGVVVGNPPFKFAQEFVEKALSVCDDYGTVIFLLPLSFLESEKRYKTMFTNFTCPSQVLVSTHRISFTGNNKSDNTAYAIYIWEKGNCEYNTGEAQLKWLNWTPEKKKRTKIKEEEVNFIDEL
jgi:hypothetical protein